MMTDNTHSGLLSALIDLLKKAPLLIVTGAVVSFGVGFLLGKLEPRPYGSALDLDLQTTGNAPAGALSVLPDFAQVNDVDTRKRLFFDYLESYAKAENARILALREELKVFDSVLANAYPLSPMEKRRLLAIAQEYRLEQGVGPIAELGREEIDEILDDEAALVATLLLRADAIPVSLVLAQAANESAWGTSRFAVDGNNLFGQWCYVQGCGFVPYERSGDASHEVRRFKTIAGAVAAYFRNLNTHPSYQHFRRMRARMREQSRALDPIQLAYGLGSYSQRGDHYVDEVQTIIQQNDLHLRDGS